MRRLFAALLFFLALCPPAQAWTKVQGAASSCGGATTRPVTVAALGQGNLVIVAIDWAGANTISSVVDNASSPNTYTAISGTTIGTNPRVVLYFNANVNPGATTITVTFSALTTACVIAEEFSGNVTTSALDPASGTGQAQTAVTGTDSVSSGNLTTTIAGDLIYGVTAETDAGDRNIAIGTGYTVGVQHANTNASSSTTNFSTEYKVQGSAGATPATFTPSASGNWVTAVAGFKAAAGGAGGHSLGTLGVGR